MAAGKYPSHTGCFGLPDLHGSGAAHVPVAALVRARPFSGKLVGCFTAPRVRVPGSGTSSLDTSLTSWWSRRTFSVILDSMGNLLAIANSGEKSLSVASLEDKQQHLAGPRLLNRLSGEAWRATEHLSVAQIRSDEGWLKVLQSLDAHYRFLPETELHESIDEFLFLLKRKGGEGATAFASRFKTQLHRLETLIHQEKYQRNKR